MFVNIDLPSLLHNKLCIHSIHLIVISTAHSKYLQIILAAEYGVIVDKSNCGIQVITSKGLRLTSQILPKNFPFGVVL